MLTRRPRSVSCCHYPRETPNIQQLNIQIFERYPATFSDFAISDLKQFRMRDAVWPVNGVQTCPASDHQAPSDHQESTKYKRRALIEQLIPKRFEPVQTRRPPPFTEIVFRPLLSNKQYAKLDQVESTQNSRNLRLFSEQHDERQRTTSESPCRDQTFKRPYG